MKHEEYSTPDVDDTTRRGGCRHADLNTVTFAPRTNTTPLLQDAAMSPVLSFITTDVARSHAETVSTVTGTVAGGSINTAEQCLVMANSSNTTRIRRSMHDVIRTKKIAR